MPVLLIFGAGLLLLLFFIYWQWFLIVAGILLVTLFVAVDEGWGGALIAFIGSVGLVWMLFDIFG